MFKAVFGVASLLICFYSHAIAQDWEAVALGPGSEPGTLLVEISGVVSYQGGCGPDPFEHACSVYYTAVEGRVSPCARVIADGGWLCGPDDDDATFIHTAVPDQPFAFQIEIQEGVTYTVTGAWRLGAYLDGFMSDCYPDSDCWTSQVMTPDPLILTAAVPAASASWTVLKSNYRTD